MKFKYNVIGDNTAENREWLRKLGYKNVNDNILGDILYIPTSYRDDVSFYITTHTPVLSLILKDYVIDCRNNDALFRSVSAVRDDSDYMQWFISDIDFYGKEWFLCEKDRIKDCSIYCSFTKATIEELKEHFK